MLGASTWFGCVAAGRVKWAKCSTNFESGKQNWDSRQPMLWIKTLVLPLVVSLNGVGNWLLKLFGVNRQEQTADQYYTPEELQLIVQESEELGAIRAESGQMLQTLFEFGSLTAGEVMVPRVRITGIPLGSSPADIRELLLPVLDTTAAGLH